MVHWTQEATGNFQEYLDQVAAYALHQGGNPEEAVQSIRSELARKIQEQSIDVVDANVLYQLVESERPPENDVASEILSATKKTSGCVGCVAFALMLLGGVVFVLLVISSYDHHKWHKEYDDYMDIEPPPASSRPVEPEPEPRVIGF